MLQNTRLIRGCEGVAHERVGGFVILVVGGEEFACAIWCEAIHEREMLADLQNRGKTVETNVDSQAMHCRWLRLQIQREVDAALATLASEEDVPMDLDVDYGVQEPEQQQSLQQETEKTSASLQADILQDVPVEHCPEEFGFFDVTG